MLLLPARRTSSDSTTTTAAQSTLSGNWAGLVLETLSEGGHFTEVGGTSYTAACAWVCFDGWLTGTGADGLLQAGVDLWMEDNKLTYNAWYEWVPDTSWNFTGFDIAAGDVITLRLVAETDRSGTIYLENETGQTTSMVLDAPPTPPFSNPRIPMRTVERIMETLFWYGQVPLADFGSIVFTESCAKTNTGERLGLSGSTVINLQLNEIRTDVTIDSDSAATIKYLP
ncbi:peptidase G1 [Daedaleopsis nitida]|nr:peptidase G1 [Daedaleopsis nitida]